MAETFLSLSNRVARRINETELSSVSSQRGVHAAILDAVNDAIDEINTAELQWPFNFAKDTQTLTPGISEYAFDTTMAHVDWNSFFLLPAELITNGDFATDVSSWTDIDSGTGTSSYVSTGNGRLNLAAGASGVAARTQAITTVTGKTYRVKTLCYGGTVTLYIGTTSGGTEISTTSLTIDNLNRGQFDDTSFVATGTTTYITLRSATDANHQVDWISVKEDFTSKKLLYIEYDKYLDWFVEGETDKMATSYDKPRYVYPTPNDKFGVVPVPLFDYYVTFDTWTVDARLTTASEEIRIPERYSNVIINGAMHYMYLFKEDFEQAGILGRRFRDGINQMRAELIGKPQDMRGSNYGRETNTNVRASGW